MRKISNQDESICLFCGKEKIKKHDGYYECNCSDAAKTRNINERIKELKRSKPKPKYKIINGSVLHE